MSKKGRNEHSQNRTDATPCLSDVYNIGTRAKRRLADVRLSGRSMVEMLGVLAIVGVLSVGAVGGYAKAMFKYKLNKQAEQLNTVFNTAAQYVGLITFDNSEIENMATDIFLKLDLIPSEMVKPDTIRYVYDVFANRIYIGISGKSADREGRKYSNGIFTEVMLSNSENNNNLEICRNVILTAKENKDILWYLETYFREGEAPKQTIYNGARYCSGGNCITNLTYSKIEAMCRGFSKEAESFTFRVWFK